MIRWFVYWRTWVWWCNMRLAKQRRQVEINTWCLTRCPDAHARADRWDEEYRRAYRLWWKWERRYEQS